MKLTKTIMTIGGLAAALLSGAMATAQEKAESKPDQKAAANPNRAGPASIDRTAYWAKFLDLTDDQKPKIKAVMDEENAQMRVLREDKSLTPQTRMPMIREIREPSTTKVNPIVDDPH